MISNRFLRPLTRQFINRYNSTLSKQQSSLTTNKNEKTSSEYLAADMYNYNIYSYYDIETISSKYRLPQPSANASLKSPESVPQKK